MNDNSDVDNLKDELTLDVKARMLAEEKFLESESVLRSVIDNIQDIFYRSDNSGKLVIVSRSWLELAGYDSFDECIGKDIAETFYYNPDERDNFLEMLRRDSRVTSYEIVLKKKDGTPIVMETNSHIYYDRDGNPAGVEGILRDMTGHKKAEQELRRSEEMMKAIVNASPVPMFVIDREHHVILWNRALEENSGVSADEIIGTDLHWRAFYESKRPCLSDLIVDGDWAKLEELYGGKYTPSSLIEGAYEAFGFYPEMKGGIWLYYTAAPIRGEDGEITGAVETLIDITESKKSEKVLQESEERFRTIFDNSPLGIVLTTLDGYIISANRFFCDMMGYGEEEVIGLTVADISFEGDYEKENPMVRKLYDSRYNYYTFEKRYRKKGGDCIWGHVSITYIHDTEGRRVSAIAIIENISDRKKADEEIKRIENQLIQSQKSEALGILAGGIAHDFNNILAAIIGYGGLAKLHIKNPDKALSDIDEALKSADRAKNLVNQILAFSRKTMFNYAPVELYSAISDSLKMLRSIIPADIEIRENIEENIMVMSEPTQIHQILMNLGINAVQAMEKEGGILTVTLGGVTVSGEDAKTLELSPGQYAKLSVSDTGYGMTPDVVKRIFLPFFTTKEVGRGTGLGLSVIQGIIKKHEGTIICKSTPGKGTIFDIYIPAIKTVFETPTKSREEDIITGSGSILFVDDEPAIVAMVTEMLKTLGYNVVAETSSVKALELFMENPGNYDLVITDMTMPVMTGDRLVEKIKAVRGEIPVIICTGYSERLSEKRIREIGVFKLCMKPLDLKSTAAVIHEVLHGK